MRGLEGLGRAPEKKNEPRAPLGIPAGDCRGQVRQREQHWSGPLEGNGWSVLERVCGGCVALCGLGRLDFPQAPRNTEEELTASTHSTSTTQQINSHCDNAQ